jgi:NAD(P)-dependent dehydrogenase (short-subunit alcohol dehydrogenase family)
VDVVVNAVGITHVSTLEEMTLTEFEAIIRGNLTAAFLVSRAAVRSMKRAGVRGAIINVSSVSGKLGFAKVTHYCAAKAGIIGLTRALAAEVARHGISVNAICPGIVRTNMWEYLLDEFTRPTETREQAWQRMQAMIPTGVAQTPQQIARAVRLLVACHDVTGQAISVDGGMSPG